MNGAKKRIRLVVTIDVECDKGSAWAVRQPLAFNNVTEGIPGRLQPLFDEFRIRPTYLLSPEVIRDEECVRTFQALASKSELGTHLHSEFIDPEADMQTRSTSAFQADFTPEIEKAKLAGLTGLFADAFGFRPLSFRAGRYGISRFTLGFLAELGYRVDSSVTPFLWWFRGPWKGVNFLGAPAHPYQPSTLDFRQRGDVRLTEVPISIVDGFWKRIPRWIQWRFDPFNRWHLRVLNTVFRWRKKPTWLRPTFSTAEAMLKVSRMLCDEQDSPVLCMMFHSNEATAGMSPYNATEEEVAQFLRRLEDYLRMLSEEYRVVPVGLSDVCV